MSGDEHDQGADLAELTDDQRAGLACVNCGGGGGPMRDVIIEGEDRTSVVSAHVDSGVCVRYIARYIADVHLRLMAVVEHAADILASAANARP